MTKRGQQFVRRRTVLKPAAPASPVLYINWATLHRDILALAAKLPRDLVGIVGIPRSGMLVANLLATHCHLPLGDIDSFLVTGKFWSSGKRMDTVDHTKRRGSLLLLDDSLNTGCEMTRRAKVLQANLSFCTTLLRGVMYPVPAMADQVDLYVRTVRQPRSFAWNWHNKSATRGWAFDMDGVLAPDPPPEDDEAAYRQHISTIGPLYLPHWDLGWIVTSRLEKWREITQQWLQTNGVNLSGELMMRPEQTIQQRRKAGGYGEWKGRIYSKLPARLFVESNPKQAAAIAKVSGKAVLCTDTDTYFPAAR